jgi:UDP-4-amino-4,6-dideoxy-N-acetyl-beta-L-altrosamine transaminase
MSTTHVNNVAELAIRGGAPVRKTWLPYGRQDISDADVDAVVKTLRSDWLTQGPAIADFEKSVTDTCAMKYAVAVSNGTAALHAAYFAAGIKEGDEVILPGMSFAATANAALYLGAKPVFVDIHPESGLIDVQAARRAVSPRTRAIVGVDFCGHPCDMSELRTLADEIGVPLIIDGAHALGAMYKGRPAPQSADLTTFSFHPVKSITTGEGGMIVTNNEQFAHRMRIFRSHGIDKDSQNFVNENQGPWYHEMQELGFNYRLTDFQAALGTSQMARLDAFVNRRREIAAVYRQKLASLKHFRCLTEHPDVRSAYHLFPVLVTKEPFGQSRKFVVEALHGENIGVQVHYIPIYAHPYYQKVVCDPAPSCPNTDTFYQQVLSLPMYPMMTDNDLADVVLALQKVDRALSESAS